MHCKTCGDQLPEDAAFCLGCGASQDPSDQQPNESHEEWVARLGSQTFEATTPQMTDRRGRRCEHPFGFSAGSTVSSAAIRDQLRPSRPKLIVR